MANIKITDLTAYTDPAATDVLPIVDVGADVTKKISIQDLLENAGSGTAAAPGIAFDGDSDTGIYRPGANQLALSTNSAEALRIDSDGNILVVDGNNLQIDEVRARDGDGLKLFDDGGAGIFVQDGGNVGIGTSSPSFSSFGSNSGGIHIKEVGSSNSGIKIEQGSNRLHLMSSSSKNYIFSDSNTPLGITTNGTERLSITASGNVGIGTTSPDALLHLDGASGANQLYFGLSGTPRGIIEATSDGLQITGASTSRNITFVTAGLERGRWDTSGRLLVGTSSAPSGGSTQYTKLGLFGNSLNNTASILCLSYGTAATSLSAGIGIGRLFFGDPGAAEFASISCETDGSTGSGDYPGRLVFSVTADGASSPTERMRISSTGFTATYCDSGNNNLSLGNASTAGTTNTFLFGVYGRTSTVSGGTTSVRIYTNGNIENTNNSYTGISDIKLKENVVDANSQWDDLKALQVRNYNFKEGQTHTQIGLIAQEVELISPGLVSESPDRDEDGNDLGTVTKSVNYSVLYMKAVKALQEAMERIETLEAKVAALEAS